MKKIAIYGLSALVWGLSACDGFLTEEPVVSQSNEITLSTYEGLSKATLGAYTFMNDGTWYGANFVLSCELRAGNAKNPTNTDFTSGRYTNEYSWNYTSSTTSDLWKYAYFAIAAANNVINNLEGKESSEVTQQDLDNLKGEALFIRALGHFDLVRLYAQPYTSAPQSLGVPVMLVSELGLPARNTVAEVYDQVVKDLLLAESIIEDDYTHDGVADKFASASKPAIQALLSRVYLYMGEWQKAADYATKVIESGKFSMFNAEQLPSIWGQDVASDKGEVIFEIYGSKQNEYNEYWEDIAWLTYPDGYADVASTNDLRSLYEEGDVRGTLFRSHEKAPDHFWTTKYPGKDLSVRPTFNNIIVLRLSEMYLNRAEALAHGATIPGATAESDLQTITSNRGASAVAATLDNILKERRKELAFEGHLVYDMARTGTALHRVDYEGSANAKDINFPDYRWALPIPKKEIDANPNIVQNEGY